MVWLLMQVMLIRQHLRPGREAMLLRCRRSLGQGKRDGTRKVWTAHVKASVLDVQTGRRQREIGRRV